MSPVCYFRAGPSQNGEKYVTSPPPPIVERVLPQSLNDSLCMSARRQVERTEIFICLALLPFYFLGEGVGG